MVKNVDSVRSCDDQFATMTNKLSEGIGFPNGGYDQARGNWSILDALHEDNHSRPDRD